MSKNNIIISSVIGLIILSLIIIIVRGYNQNNTGLPKNSTVETSNLPAMEDQVGKDKSPQAIANKQNIKEKSITLSPAEIESLVKTLPPKRKANAEISRNQILVPSISEGGEGNDKSRYYSQKSINFASGVIEDGASIGGEIEDKNMFSLRVQNHLMIRNYENRSSSTVPVLSKIIGFYLGYTDPKDDPLNFIRSDEDLQKRIKRILVSEQLPAGDFTQNRPKESEIKKNIIWANLEENRPPIIIPKTDSKPERKEIFKEKGIYFSLGNSQATNGTYITFVSEKDDVTKKITDRVCTYITYNKEDILCLSDQNLISLKTGKEYSRDTQQMLEDDDGNLYLLSEKKKVFRLKVYNPDDQKKVLEITSEDEEIQFGANTNQNETLIKIKLRPLRGSPTDGYTIQIKNDEPIKRPDYKNYIILI